MSSERPYEEVSISDEADAAASAERVAEFRSKVPDVSGQVAVTAHFAEPMARALGLDPSKISADLAGNLRELRDQINRREAPPLEESRSRLTRSLPPEE